MKKIDEYLSAYPFPKKKVPSADEVVDMLTKWYNEDPIAFQAKYSIGEGKELTLTDFYTTRANSEKYFLQKYFSQGYTTIPHDEGFKRDKEIADTLKNLGVPLTISDEEVQVYAKQAAREM